MLCPGGRDLSLYVLGHTDWFRINLFLGVNVFVLFPHLISRIIGKTARSQDIYYSVSVNIQKNFAKTKWKVGPH